MENERDKLVLQHLEIARMAAATFYRKYRQFDIEFDDLLQSARLGLIQGAAAIVEKKNVRDIPAYLLLSANNECKNLLVISGLLKFRTRKKYIQHIPMPVEFFCGAAKKCVNF